MSNIAVYKTSNLDVSTNFTNQFLDGLLEQYCSSRYKEDTVISKDCIPCISLEDLILFAYPGYYYKSPGLYGSNTSTQVIIVYEEHLHNTLQEALSHKLSRLFVRYASRIPLLSFCTEESFTSPWRYNRDFRTDYISIENRSLLEQYLKETLPDIKTSDLDLSSFTSRLRLATKQSESYLVYKPSSKTLLEVDKLNKAENYSKLQSLGSVARDSEGKVFTYWLALHLLKNTDIASLVEKCLTPAAFENIRTMASSHLLLSKPLIYSFICGLRAKRDAILKKEELATARIYASNPKPIAKPIVKPSTTVAVQQDEPCTKECSDIVERHTVPKEDNTGITIFIVYVVVALLLFILFS